jgi:hypothetical protein
LLRKLSAFSASKDETIVFFLFRHLNRLLPHSALSNTTSRGKRSFPPIKVLEILKNFFQEVFKRVQGRALHKPFLKGVWGKLLSRSFPPHKQNGLFF